MKSRLAFIATLISLGLVCRLLDARRSGPSTRSRSRRPRSVHEVDLVNADGSAASFPQYWKRNTLVIDLSGVERRRQRDGDACRRIPPGRCASRCGCDRAASSSSKCRARNATCCRWRGRHDAHRSRARCRASIRRRPGAIYITWGSHAAVRRSGDRVRKPVSFRRRSSAGSIEPPPANPRPRAPTRSSRPPKSRRSASAATRAPDARRRRAAPARSAGVEIHRGQRAAPHATRIERQQVLRAR